MARNQDGEFEVLLGNKQLLSIFFIVVILLGVFFTMGYILGKNSAVSGRPATTAGRPAAEPPSVPGATTSSFSQEQTKDDVRPLVENATAPAKTRPAAPAADQAEPPKKVATPALNSAPVPGKTYLQVAAVKRPMAELVAEVLQKKGFHCILLAHPTEPVFRVLVGPAADADAVTKLRQDLEAAGFRAIPRKY